MTKSRRHGRAKDRVNPILKLVKPPSDPELAALREKKILPIINDLQSVDYKKRSAVAIAVANTIENKRCRKLLLREQIVRILLEQTVRDQNLDSRSAGWGVLRNLVLAEEADFCIHLYRQDVLTAIQETTQHILDTIDSREQPTSKVSNSQMSLIWTLCASILGLVSSLAEAQDEILDAITRIPIIIRFVFKLLNVGSTPGNLFSEALICLTILTEDNELIASQIINHGEWLNGLMRWRELGGVEGVSACGILHNVFSAMQWFDHSTPMEGVSDAILLPTLTLQITDAHVQVQLNGNCTYFNANRVLQMALETIASIATSLQGALKDIDRKDQEIQCFGDEESTYETTAEERPRNVVFQEENDPDRVEEVYDKEKDADIELLEEHGFQKNNTTKLPQPTLSALLYTTAPVVVSILVDSWPNEAVQHSARSALNNIAWIAPSIDADLMAGKSNSSRAWPDMVQHIWSEAVSPVLVSNTADISLASLTTSLAWGLAHSVQGEVRLRPEEQKRFIALYQASRKLSTTNRSSNSDVGGSSGEENDDEFQGLGVKCIGVLGRLALDPAPIPLNREIGVFLMAVLSGLPETPAADAIEALNQIFDIYAGKEYACNDAVFWADGFYNHLEATAQKIWKMAKSIDKRRKVELRQRSDEVVLNLKRFLVYKRKERFG